MPCRRGAAAGAAAAGGRQARHCAWRRGGASGSGLVLTRTAGYRGSRAGERCAQPWSTGWSHWARRWSRSRSLRTMRRRWPAPCARWCRLRLRRSCCWCRALPPRWTARCGARSRGHGGRAGAACGHAGGSGQSAGAGAAGADGLPVVGIPTCARSPKLNGFDFVLRRFAAGVRRSRLRISGHGRGRTADGNRIPAHAARPAGQRLKQSHGGTEHARIRRKEHYAGGRWRAWINATIRGSSR